MEPCRLELTKNNCLGNSRRDQCVQLQLGQGNTSSDAVAAVALGRAEPPHNELEFSRCHS